MVVVGCEIVDEPALRRRIHRGNVVIHLVLHKTLNLGTADSHIDDTHFDIRRQVCHHGTSEIVGHAEYHCPIVRAGLLKFTQANIWKRGSMFW